MTLLYTCIVQEQWFQIPRTADELAARWSELDLLAEGDLAGQRLREAAEVLRQDVEKDDHPDRFTWCGVGERAVGEISAVMTIEPVKMRGVGLDDLLAAWSDEQPGEGIDVWLREYQKKELAGRRAISGHEILQAPVAEDGQRKLSEIYRAAVTAPGLATFMLMTITTNDLAVFDDIVGYGDILADTFEFPPPEEAP